ncbi:protein DETOXIFICATION 46, chloroplastic-like isoform X2 [Zingiber officinale]|nr:protein DETOXIFICATION 46, chloroplastic-like isoform X2 [Zingiber officinale]
MMLETLNKSGYSAFLVCIPSLGELLQILAIAAPVFITMTSKVAFYSLITYSATSMGTITLAAHQVMVNVFCMFTVWGEPLSQTAQSFMPELIHGVNRSLQKMHKILLPYFLALVVTPSIHSLEGTLLAGRDLRFLSLSMSGCFCSAGLILLLVSSTGFGLPGCWWALVAFQWARFTLALQRLLSPRGMLYNEGNDPNELVKLKAT